VWGAFGSFPPTPSHVSGLGGGCMCVPPRRVEGRRLRVFGRLLDTDSDSNSDSIENRSLASPFYHRLCAPSPFFLSLSLSWRVGFCRRPSDSLRVAPKKTCSLAITVSGNERQTELYAANDASSASFRSNPYDDKGGKMFLRPYRALLLSPTLCAISRDGKDHIFVSSLPSLAIYHHL
jgi:hypothetical protein